MIIDTKEVIMPSDPALVKKIKDALFEASASYTTHSNLALAAFT